MKRGKFFRDRKIILLAVLIILLVVVNIRQWRPAGGGLPAAREKTRLTSGSIVEQDPTLMADQLKEPKVIFQEEKRNIFSFFQKAPPSPSRAEETPAVEAASPQAVCGNSVCEEGEDPTNCPTDCRQPPPPPPVITLRYIGYMSEPNGSVAFLTDGKEVYMARVNDVVANQYRVLKITEDIVELGLLNNNQSSTIRFQGNQGG